MNQAQQQNRLTECSSPYLRQHAGNPVNWQPWDEAALESARTGQRPILLSIGYSACHWCHVMAHESFEDPDIAEQMNRLFVCIKVDREERPDLDRIYQQAHQLLTQRGGGWPLTVFLTPDDHLPFFAGTYFPRDPRQGMPGFGQVLEQVAQAWNSQRESIREQNRRMQQALQRLSEAGTDAPDQVDDSPLQAARAALGAAFAPQHGGFGDAPKFPQPGALDFLLRRYARTGDREALHMACHTLRRMALGGINDQVGGGFARYSVDPWWMIPHFEKMLSDNGLLIALYTDAWQATGDTFYARIARETADWVLKEMRHVDGGFFSALDADSEGLEGRYYTWTPGEVERLLSEQEYRLVEQRFGLDDAANFEGRWHFHVYASLSELAKTLRTPKPQVEELLASARDKLYAARRRRVSPGRDDKILTAWNALTIRGLARCGRLLDQPELLDAAERATDFLHQALWDGRRLYASWADGQRGGQGFLDDAAYLLDALLELLRSRWRHRDLQLATALADALLEDFQAPEGGFYFTPEDHEALVQRPRPLMDDSLPAGNGVAARALQQLGLLVADSRYIEASARTVYAAWNAVNSVPEAHCSLLMALEEVLQPPKLVLLRGGGAQLEDWRKQAERYYAPGRHVYLLPEQQPLPPVLAAHVGEGDGPRAWVCEGNRCLPAVDNLEALLRLL
ncbi:MAG: thioredoxin domain-containing protein [Ectothiorhodospiraceae bacterium]|nr:thioredoxin domain-containing protein [Ectothiorhodospiraceae bacterium]MCH8505451.1 thioredoxin domain-containing protein [Ectothiorhodospiraceae bacterium]